MSGGRETLDPPARETPPARRGLGRARGAGVRPGVSGRGVSLVTGVGACRRGLTVPVALCFGLRRACGRCAIRSPRSDVGPASSPRPRGPQALVTIVQRGQPDCLCSPDRGGRSPGSAPALGRQRLTVAAGFIAFLTVAPSRTSPRGWPGCLRGDGPGRAGVGVNAAAPAAGHRDTRANTAGDGRALAAASTVVGHFRRRSPGRHGPASRVRVALALVTVANLRCHRAGWGLACVCTGRTPVAPGRGGPARQQRAARGARARRTSELAASERSTPPVEDSARGS